MADLGVVMAMIWDNRIFKHEMYKTEMYSTNRLDEDVTRKCARRWIETALNVGTDR